jgi:hypothetical protein
VSVYRDVRDGSNLAAEYRAAALLWSLGANLGVRIGEGLTAQLNANHFPTQWILQGRTSGHTWTTLALRQQVWDRKGTVSLSVVDPLKLNRFDSWSRDATFVQESRSSFDSRVVTVGFSYSFGRQPERRSRLAPEPQEPDVGETIRMY